MESLIAVMWIAAGAATWVHIHQMTNGLTEEINAADWLFSIILCVILWPLIWIALVGIWNRVNRNMPK